jgi:hypothetical protein
MLLPVGASTCDYTVIKMIVWQGRTFSSLTVQVSRGTGEGGLE